MGRGSLTGSHYIRFVSYLCLCRPKQRKTARPGPGGVVEAAGLEPASASASSVRFYERSSRFSFAYRDGPGRRREASPLNVPPAHRARTRGVIPLNDTGYPGRGPPGPMRRCYLSSDGSQIIFGVCCFAGVLRVSSKLGSSRGTQTAHVETGTPPLRCIFYHFGGVFQFAERGAASGGGAPSWRAPSRARRSCGRSRAACRTASCGWRRRARA